jgi:hypothetical protein
MEALLEKGVNPQAEYDLHPIFFDASLPHLRILLRHGLDINVPSSHNGMTMLNYLCFNHNRWDPKRNHTERITLEGAKQAGDVKKIEKHAIVGRPIKSARIVGENLIHTPHVHRDGKWDTLHVLETIGPHTSDESGDNRPIRSVSPDPLPSDPDTPNNWYPWPLRECPHAYFVLDALPWDERQPLGRENQDRTLNPTPKERRRWTPPRKRKGGKRCAYDGWDVEREGYVGRRDEGGRQATRRRKKRQKQKQRQRKRKQRKPLWMPIQIQGVWTPFLDPNTLDECARRIRTLPHAPQYIVGHPELFETFPDDREVPEKNGEGHSITKSYTDSA